MTRDEAIKWLQGIEERYFHGGDEAYDKKRREAVRMAIEALEHNRGEWQVYYDEDSPQDGIWKCSICSYIRLIDEISPTNFCPNCGADMRGDEDG